MIRFACSWTSPNAGNNFSVIFYPIFAVTEEQKGFLVETFKDLDPLKTSLNFLGFVNLSLLRFWNFEFKV